MIILCTGKPKFEADGAYTVVSFPSGKGEAVRVALNRNQLCYLMQFSQRAMVEAFDKPQPDLTVPLPFRRGSGE